MPNRFLLLPIGIALTGFTLADNESTEGKISEDIITAPGLEDTTYIGPLEDAYERIDPTKDGWATEAFNEEAGAQLKALVHLLDHPAELNAGSLTPLTTPDFTARPLHPPELSEAFRDSGFHVRRGLPSTDPIPSSTGPKAFAGTLHAWLKTTGLHGPDAHPHVKFKLYRVIPGEKNTANAQILVTLTGTNDGQRRQINAEWNTTWTTQPEELPLLNTVRVESYEEVTATTTDSQPLFSEVTTSVLGNTKAYREQFLRSSDHWRVRIPRDFGLDAPANHGLAIGDINGDGLEDLYVCQQGGLPNRLFLRNPDGTLRDFTAESKTGWLDYCASALIVDLDNDGDKDLVVSQDFKILFLDNLDGKGHFELAFGISAKAQTFSLTAADVDEDGFLDVYSCGYNTSAAEQRAGAMGAPVPFHDANNGGANILWRNLGNWEFEDITAQVGLDVDNRRFTFAASWEDFDNDGDLDLYVANDYGRNCLYRNDGKGLKFKNIAAELDLEDTSAGMSTSWADFDRNGWMDLHISNMFSSAGNRITYQGQFKSDTPDDVRAQYQRMARGNTLYQADGKGGFNDVSIDMGITMGRWSWGSAFADLNNDGWEDILVANGFITTEDTGDL